MNRDYTQLTSDSPERHSSQDPDLQSLRAFVDVVASLLYFGTSDRAIGIANTQFVDDTGTPATVERNSHLDAYVHPDDLPGLKSWWGTLIEALEAGETELSLSRHDGGVSVVPVENWANRLSCWSVFWCGMAVDIDNQKRSMQLLQEKA